MEGSLFKNAKYFLKNSSVPANQPKVAMPLSTQLCNCARLCTNSTAPPAVTVPPATPATIQ